MRTRSEKIEIIEGIKASLHLCAAFPLQPQLPYTWSLFMWKCPCPRPNHKGPPQPGVWAEVTQIDTVSPPIFSLLVVVLRWAAFKAGIENWQHKGECGALRPLHIITARKNTTFSCILRHSCLQVTQCPLSYLKEFIVFPVSVDCRLPRRCCKINVSCTCGIQRFLLGKEQHRMNTKLVLWIHAALHHTSHVESQLCARQVDRKGVFTAATLQF